MIHRVFFLLIFLFSRVSFAEPYQFLIAGTAESRMERDQNQSYVYRPLRGFSLGAGKNGFIYSYEYASFAESTGENSIVVDRKVENHLLWVLWSPATWKSFVPFLGGGIGQTKETIETTVLGSSTEDHSRPSVMGGGCFGLRADMPYLWVSVELRVMGSEHGDPNPTAGIMGRLGLFF